MTPSGRLTLVGTPIGNLEDISPRAVRALAEADVAFCEDTRRTRALYSALGLPSPGMVRLDRHTEQSGAGRVVEAVLAGRAVVLVTDAGMPGVSDPGPVVVRAVADAGGRVDVVPGPDAVSSALALSGLTADAYLFMGFLPRKGRERSAALEQAAASSVTVVFFESPQRVKATLADLLAVCGPDRAVVAARELTKIHEECRRGTLGEAASWFAGGARGEFVLLLGGAAAGSRDWSDEELVEALRAAAVEGADRKGAVAIVAARCGVPKRRVYELSLNLD